MHRCGLAAGELRRARANYPSERRAVRELRASAWDDRFFGMYDARRAWRTILQFICASGAALLLLVRQTHFGATDSDRPLGSFAVDDQEHRGATKASSAAGYCLDRPSGFRFGSTADSIAFSYSRPFRNPKRASYARATDFREMPKVVMAIKFVHALQFGLELPSAFLGGCRWGGFFSRSDW